MTYDEYPEMHPAKQLIYLILSVIGCFFIGLVVSMALIVLIYGRGMLSQISFGDGAITGDTLNAIRIFIAFGNTLFPLLAPALFFTFLIVRNPAGYLKTGSSFNWTYLLLAVLALFITEGFLPMIEFLGNINQQLHLPAALSGLQNWIQAQETATQQAEAMFLDMKTPFDLAISLLIVGLLPAIAEEFIFRGCMQTIFTQWTRNTHAAVWITAFVFSFIHLQFLGFLPRLLLGAVFGYFVAWSGSIWLSVWAHFINNGTAVIMMYLFQHKLTGINPDSTHLFSVLVLIFSTLITLILLVVYKKIADAKLQPAYDEYEDDEKD